MSEGTEVPDPGDHPSAQSGGGRPGSRPAPDAPDAPGREPLPWFRRITFRVTLSLAGLALVAYFGFPKVHGLALRAFGLPDIHQRIVRVDPLVDFGGDLDAFAEADLRPLHDVRAIADFLLRDAESVAPGRWQPIPERVRLLDRQLRVRGQGFVYVDGDRCLVAASKGLEIDPTQPDEGPGNVLGAALDPFLLEKEPPETVEGSNSAVGRVIAPAYVQGDFAGWLLFLPLPPGSQPIEDGATYLERPRFDRTRVWSARVLNLAAIAFIGGLGLFLSWFLSRLVTRRVTRLSEMADAEPTGPDGLPGPFDEDGEDEIARLARAMNAMRSRVKGLLEDVREGDRSRRRWIAQVSHDLRTPLTALIASLERAEGDLRRGRAADLGEQLEVARLDAERLNELAEDLLDIARLDTEEPRILEPVPPGELVRQAARALRTLADRSRVRLEVEVEPRLPELEADGRRLMRALENLLRNAVQHAERSVVARATRRDGCVRFAVLDDGPGLPVGEGDIWSTLAQRRSRPDSAGLGLVVVRKVADLHGGRTGAENRPEGGACLWFEIPRTEGGGTEPGSPPPPAPGARLRRAAPPSAAPRRRWWG